MYLERNDFVHKNVKYMLVKASSDSCENCAFEFRSTAFEACISANRNCTKAIYVMNPDPINLAIYRMTS